MNYTVVGLFRTAEEAQRASERLDDAGFEKENVDYSPYRYEGDYEGEDFDYDEDERSGSFWDRLFGADEPVRRTYSAAGARSNVVTVYTDDEGRAERARDIMDENGAISVDDHIPTGYNEAGYAAGTAVEGTQTQNFAQTTEGSDKVEVVKEELNVGKREVEQGGVRLRSRIIERPVEESVRLREERVYVKRQPVDRAVTDADRAFQNQTVEMSETHEVPVVDKTARVVEEIELAKDVTERDETISDTVRETEVDVENLGSDRRDDLV